MTVRVRPARIDDAPALLEIYRPLVEQTAVSFETEAPGVAEFAARIGEALASHAWLVAELENGPVGYAYASTHRARPAYRWSVETSAYVHPDCRGQGVGRALYLALLPELERRGFCNAFAAIALPNPASIALHLSVGFQPIGVFRSIGWKLNAWHDVGWYQRRLRPDSTPPLTG